MKRSNPCVENLKIKIVTLTLRNSETTNGDKQVDKTLKLRDQASRIGKQNQFCAVARSCLTLCVPMDCSTPGFPVLHKLLEFVQTHVHWGDDAIQSSQICHLLLLLPSIFLRIKVFSNEQALPIRQPKYWSFSFCPSNEYSGLISFRIDWFDLPVVQGTLKSLLQPHSLKASVLQCSAFFLTQRIFPRTPNLS